MNDSLSLCFQKQIEAAQKEALEAGNITQDPDETAQKLAEKENRDGKTFNFKANQKFLIYDD